MTEKNEDRITKRDYCYKPTHIKTELDSFKISQAFNKLQKYENIGTVEEFEVLKEKSEPNKPHRKPNADMTHEEVTCPSCGKYISEYTNRKYCDCGKALNWK